MIVFSCKDEQITMDKENTVANTEAPVSLKAGAIDMPGNWRTERLKYHFRSQ